MIRSQSFLFSFTYRCNTLKKKMVQLYDGSTKGIFSIDGKRNVNVDNRKFMIEKKNNNDTIFLST